MLTLQTNSNVRIICAILADSCILRLIIGTNAQLYIVPSLFLVLARLDGRGRFRLSWGLTPRPRFAPTFHVVDLHCAGQTLFLFS